MEYHGGAENEFVNRHEAILPRGAVPSTAILLVMSVYRIAPNFSKEVFRQTSQIVR